MFKKLLCLSLVVLFGYAAGICRAKYSGGNGSESNPYRISNAYDMNDIGLHQEDWGSHFVMVNNINLAQFTGTQFNIIGNESNEFTGVFDGNGLAIFNFSYNSSGTHYIGLFGYVDDANAAIKDLTLINPNVYAGETARWVGSLAGRLFRGTITNCNAEGANISGFTSIGGLVGDNGSGTISNCYATGNVNGNYNIGGLVGSNIGGTISNCYATASVNGNTSIGGLTGNNSIFIAFLTNSNQPFLCEPMQDGMLINSYAESTIEGSTQLPHGIINSYATGNVTGDNGTGGLVGGNCIKIFGCYATGDVVGDVNAGGLVGKNYAAEILNCYATGNVTGSDNIGGLIGSSKPDWWWNWLSRIKNCYAIGGVSGTTNIGGLLGYSDGTSYNKCFWDSELNPDVNGIGNTTDPNVIGKSTAQMQTKGTFTDVGWDFVSETVNGYEDIWRLCNEGIEYPKLAWEYTLGDFVCPDGVDMRDYTVLANQWQLETLSYDVAPTGGDGIVNFLDWAVFANGWQDTTDANDLRIFAQQWLSFSAYSADIAPTIGGDGWVNELDLAIMANHWLTSLQ